jgi:hypothetical protein
VIRPAFLNHFRRTHHAEALIGFAFGAVSVSSADDVSASRNG